MSVKLSVRNIPHYCSQHPNISFLIFKEYLCVEDAVPRLRHAFNQKVQAGAEISPRAERLCIVSEILTKALHNVASCSLPLSRISSIGMEEMAAPYLFFYHHREALRQYEKKRLVFCGKISYCCYGFWIHTTKPSIMKQIPSLPKG